MIKKYFIQLPLLLLMFIPLVNQAQEFRSIDNNAFKKSEYLKMRVYYRSWITGKVTAGYADMTITEEDSLFHGRPTYHAVATGKSAKFYDWFFKVRDHFESYFDQEAFRSYYFMRRTREGGYKKDDDIYFNPKLLTATSRKATIPTPLHIQDFVSAVYFARTLDFKNAKPGETFPIDFHLDDSVYVSIVRYEGIEDIKIKMGKFRAYKFAPMMATGDVFSDEYPMYVWVSADENKIPLKAESKVVVGSVAAELVEYKNLLHPLDARIEDD
jgi:hypothetical protein